MLADLPIGEPVPYRQGSLDEDLDLHAALVPNPVCTFYMRVNGNRLRQHGIQDGDLMVIDRSVEPYSGHVVVVAHQGCFLMRPLLRQGEQWLLEPVRPEEVAIPLDLEVFDRSGLFGVVVHAVHHLNKPRLRKI
jgi:DNA polymerase V